MKLNEFPNTNTEPFIITSPPVPDYNCIAWAYGRSDVRMWPNTQYFYWPENITNNSNMSSFIELYESIGYNICKDGILELVYEKVSIFELNGYVTHASRQLQNGLWTSKLGWQPNVSYDVSHTINSISGGVYGNVVIYMKRKTT